MTAELIDDLDEHDEPELFPVVMIYITGKLDVGRGWSVTCSVQTADGKNVMNRWGRQGGSIEHGRQKMLADLDTAYGMAMESMQAFR